MPTKIEWTHVPGTVGETWNPVTGCTPVSAGCANCYAERMARRLAGRCGYPEAPRHFDVTLHPGRLERPFRWRKPRTVFVCSMGDLFHEDVPDEFIAEVWRVMYLAPEHIFQVLTKRPARMLDRFSAFAEELVLPNVWLGVTAENQRAADERVPLLLRTPAAVRFVSCEPLLEEIDLTNYLKCEWYAGPMIEPRRGTIGGKAMPAARLHLCLNWLIVGGESGSGARPMHPDWARSLRDQAQEANVPFFFKQWGAWLPAEPSGLNKSILITQRTNHNSQDSFGCISGRRSGFPEPIAGMHAVRMGKKAAGRLLDGREWNGFPEIGSRE